MLNGGSCYPVVPPCLRMVSSLASPSSIQMCGILSPRLDVGECKYACGVVLRKCNAGSTVFMNLFCKVYASDLVKFVAGSGYCILFNNPECNEMLASVVDNPFNRKLSAHWVILRSSARSCCCCPPSIAIQVPRVSRASGVPAVSGALVFPCGPEC